MLRIFKKPDRTTQQAQQAPAPIPVQTEILPDFSMMPEEKARELSPLTLAFVGDAVHTLYVRTRLATSGGLVRKMHYDAIEKVKAAAQAKAGEALLPALDEEEKRIFIRGRNAKSANIPKHADVGEYHSATGFEALLGYLYLTGRKERLCEILRMTTS
jgi:ribonuclease III family protein